MTDETQSPNDQNPELLETCRKVFGDLIRAKEAKKVWLWIADNADAINAEGFGRSFGFIQEIALTEMFMALGRAYDEEKYGEKQCIKRILDLMRSANLSDRHRFVKYLVEYKNGKDYFDRLSNEEIRTTGIEIISKQRPTSKGSEELQRVIQVRHDEIAHNAVKGLPTSYDRPTFDDVKHCLDWGREFIEMVGESFGIGTFVEEVASPAQGIRNLAHKAGIVIDPNRQALEAFKMDTSDPKKP